MEQQLYELLRQCTVRISVLKGHGTGFFVAPGLILTCAHVVKEAVQAGNASVEISWQNQAYTAQVTTWLSESDLALLQVNLAAHPCALLDEEAPRSRDPLHSYGYPDNYPGGDSLTVEYEGWTIDTQPLLKFKEGQIRPGLSGAPLLNEHTGTVCGIIQRSRGRESDLGGRAVPAATVFKVFPEIVALQQQFHREDRRWMQYRRTHLKGRATPTQESQNRQQLLESVQEICITNRLEKSLDGAAPILLELQLQLDAVLPISIDFQKRNQPAHPLPSGTHITQVYDEASGRLLILGRPGTGKTTLLLELTGELLERASGDEERPVPVVFNLSSWALKKQPLNVWLVEELHNPSTYAIPRKIGKSWVGKNRVLALLDGLDEVAEADRPACVAAINRYLQIQGAFPTVVCCRSDEYDDLPEHILLEKAIIVQEQLTPQQIEDYLARPSGQFEALRRALHDNPALREVATLPLMLNILTKLASHGEPIATLEATNSSEALEQQLFEKYVKHQLLLARESPTHYEQRETMHWLGWLAYQLKERNQSEFYIERMQPNWLSRKWAFHLLFSLLVTWLHVGLILGPLLVGLAVLNGGLSGELVGVLVLSLLVSPVLQSKNSKATEIRPVEVISWSWKRVRQNFIKILLVTGLIALSEGVAYWQSWPGGLPLSAKLALLSAGLISGFIFVLSFGLFLGLSNEMIPRIKRKPNQGIWRSAHNSATIGLLAGLVGGLIGGLVGGMIFGLVGGLVGGMIFGLFTGMSAGSMSGGLACIQHVILRLFLWRANRMPRNYPRFLDYAADRILLYKVGGGYTFTHDKLRNYLARLYTSPISDAIAEQGQHALPIRR